MYFWLENLRLLAVKFAIKRIELFFYLCYNVHFYTRGRTTLVKEGCQISRQKKKSFGSYGTQNTPLVAIFCEKSNLQMFDKNGGSECLD